MDSFTSLAWLGSAGIAVTLVWRLLIAIGTQRKLEDTLQQQESSLHQERQDLSALIESQTVTLEALTQENATLAKQVEQSQTRFAQLTADHHALQAKYAELEQNLLDNIAHHRTLQEQLQTQALEQSKLHRQVESFQQRQLNQDQQQQKIQQAHQQITEKNHLYQKAVQAAKAKIEALERDKKQLQRDLQQALYQVVSLEQDQHDAIIQTTDRGVIAAEQPISASIEPSLPMFN